MSDADNKKSDVSKVGGEESLTDFAKSLKSTVSERLSSPLFGPFVLAWCACNYRLLMAAVSNLTFKEKLEWIDSVHFAGHQMWLRGIVFPLLGTAFIVFVYPYPALWVYKFARRRNNDVVKARLQIDNERPLSVEEARQLRLAVVQMQAQVEKHQQTNNILQYENQKLLGVISEAQAKGPNQDPVQNQRLKEISMEILGILAKNQGRIRLEELERLAKKPTLVIQSGLIELQNLQLVGNVEGLYHLLPKGVTLVNDLKLIPNE